MRSRPIRGPGRMKMRPAIASDDSSIDGEAEMEVEKASQENLQNIDTMAIAKLGFTRQVSRSLKQACESFNHIIKIIDFSSSLAKKDGVFFDEEKSDYLKANRWQEMLSCLFFGHKAHLALGIFDKVSYWFSKKEPFVLDAQKMSKMFSTLEKLPLEGECYLLETLGKVKTFLEDQKAPVRAAGPLIIIYTDGDIYYKNQSLEPLIRELKDLNSRFSCQFVFRLCTSDDVVLEAFRRLDNKALGIFIEVIDDFLSEEKEVKYAGNRFLFYNKQINEIRILGGGSKILDRLDETALIPAEIRDLAAALFKDAPLHADINPQRFLHELEKLEGAKEWFDFVELKKALLSKARHKDRVIPI